MNGNKKISLTAILDGILLIVIGMIIGGGIMLWKQDFMVSKLIQNHESKYDKFSAIDYLLKSEFYDQELLFGAYDDMINGALAGYVDALNDPYTTYLKKEENSELLNELQEEAGFSGIGAVIEKKDDYAIISEIIKKSPAAKAGLLPLDRIYMVDDQSVADLDINEIVNLIRGEKGTEVNLLIGRAGKSDFDYSQFSIPVIRDEFNIPSVSSEIIQESGKNILYLEVSIIASHTTSLLLEEIREAMDEVENIDGIILDLRGNSGGYLEEAVKLLGHFFEKGTILVKTKYTAYDDIILESEGRGELGSYPLIVIVDQLTASAGEIIALAFQESGVPLVGMQTFGKGTIQSVEDFTDGSSLKYTIGKWYSSHDVSIDEEGIVPDIEIKWDYESYKKNGTDNQLERAKSELLKTMQ